MGNWEILQALVFEPRKAFAELAERPKVWFPLLVLIIATAGIAVWYSSVVDLGWVVDRELRHSPIPLNLSEEQIAQRVQLAGSQRGLRLAIGVGGVAAGIPIGMLIGALFNLLIGKVVGFERSFRQWFAFTAWTTLPTALTAIPAALVLATTESRQFGQEALQALSLNSLLLHRAIGEPGFSLFNTLNLTQVATLYLAMVGVKVWSNRSWLFAALFVGVPWVLLYGTWAWISLR